MVKKNGTQTNINNFFVIRFLDLSLTHIVPYNVQIMYIKGFFDAQKGKKVTISWKICDFFNTTMELLVIGSDRVGQFTHPYICFRNFNDSITKTLTQSCQVIINDMIKISCQNY